MSPTSFGRMTLEDKARQLDTDAGLRGIYELHLADSPDEGVPLSNEAA